MSDDQLDDARTSVLAATGTGPMVMVKADVSVTEQEEAAEASSSASTSTPSAADTVAKATTLDEFRTAGDAAPTEVGEDGLPLTMDNMSAAALVSLQQTFAASLAGDDAAGYRMLLRQDASIRDKVRACGRVRVTWSCAHARMCDTNAHGCQSMDTTS